MRKISLIFTAVAVFGMLASLTWAEAGVQKINKGASIDWNKEVYVARGEGVMPSVKEEPNRARAYQKAKGYAQMAAIANLLMAVEGTTVSYDATGKDYMQDATISQKVAGFVRNVEVVKDEQKQVGKDAMVVVEVRAPMYGQSTPGNVFMKQKFNEDWDATTKSSANYNVKTVLTPDTPKSFKKPGKAAAQDKVYGKWTAAKPSEPGHPYTSVIIDTTGYKLDRCMSPKIRTSDGSEVWGSLKVDYEFVQEHGIVAYVTSLDAARANVRCGSNPLIIHAIGRAGGKFYSDPIISDDDADLLLSENRKSGFLDEFDVIVVKDGNL